MSLPKGFSYRGSWLYWNGISLEKFVKNYSHPVYVYSLKQIEKAALRLKSSLPKTALIQYAMKANSNEKILKRLRKLGLGLDVVSGGELALGLSAGYSPQEIVFSGVGKTKEEIETAIRKNLRSINVESFSELQRILEISNRLKKVARLSLRLNPNVNARTHKHITTGRDYNKFGLSNLEMRGALELLRSNRARLQLVGLTFHLGSQIQSVGPYQAALKKTKSFVMSLISEGFPLEHFSVGGGMALRYRNEKALSVESFGDFVSREFKNLPVRAMCEPGRVLVGESGILLTEVQYVKDTGKTRFAIVDTGMHHLMRPALYDAFHEILPIQKKSGRSETYQVVGPICESTDVLGRERKFVGLNGGDKLVILNAGAYGFVMANHYNAHDLPEEIFL